MNRITVIIVLIFTAFSSICAYCQSEEDNYTPLVREGSEWVYFRILYSNQYYTYKYKIEGDSIVNGIKYKKLMRTGYHEFEDENGNPTWPYVTTVHCLLREDNKRVYGRNVDWSNANIVKLAGEYYDEETEESFLYDFNDLDKFFHDWLKYFEQKYNYAYYDGQIVFETTDTCLLVDRKCYETRYRRHHKIVEGIGAYGSRDCDVVYHLWILSGQKRIFNLVSLKNAAGEYEYFSNYYYDMMLKAQHDVNRDGTIDVADLNIVINDVLGLEQKEHYYLFGSITEDNDFDVADVNSVINYILGKTKSPLEK